MAIMVEVDAQFGALGHANGRNTPTLTALILCRQSPHIP